MIANMTRSWLVSLLRRVFRPGHASTTGASWESHMRAGSEAYQRGDHGEAEKQLKTGLEEAMAFGPEDPLVATSLNNLALVYEAQGQHAEAEPLLKRALAIMEKDFGPEHLGVAQILDNLALVYWAQGKYAETEPLYQRALAIREKSMRPEHPDVATSLENYVTLLQETGRSAEATKMEGRVEAIRAKHAEDNPVE